MKAYSYNKITKEFIEEVECQLDPLESNKVGRDIYLLPENTTLNIPPITIENKVTVFENGDWGLKDDFRNIIYYDKTTKEQHIITEINVLPDNNWTEIEPLSLDDTCKWENDNWIYDIVEVKLEKVTKIKGKAFEVIVNKLPEWKQRNLIARFLELVDKQTVTPEEETEKTGIMSEWSWVKNIRTQSDDMEAVIDTFSTLNEIADYEINFTE